jgi:hypothetical protein
VRSSKAASGPKRDEARGTRRDDLLGRRIDAKAISLPSRIQEQEPGLDLTPAPTELARAITGAIRKVLDQHGLAAFAMPRDAAIAHETAHAIVGAHEGLKIRSVRITAYAAMFGVREVVWSGRCDEAVPWSCGPHSTVDADLSRARMTIAGLAGETVTGLDKPGSSLDELVLSQTIVLGAAVKLGHPDEEAAQRLWHARVWNEALLILRENKLPFCKLADALDAREMVKGKKLREILHRVKRRGTSSDRRRNSRVASAAARQRLECRPEFAT